MIPVRIAATATPANRCFIARPPLRSTQHDLTGQYGETPGSIPGEGCDILSSPPAAWRPAAVARPNKVSQKQGVTVGAAAAAQAWHRERWRSRRLPLMLDRNGALTEAKDAAAAGRHRLHRPQEPLRLFGEG